MIVTNPPFGGKENKQVQNNFPYAIHATEALALQYIMRKVKNGGRVGMVLPEGQVMFGGGKFKEIRKDLLEKFNVFAIVSLPQGVFSLMGAGVKTYLIFFDKSGKSTREIWYYDLAGKFTKKQFIKDEDFEDALKKYEQREVSDSSWIIGIDEIIEKDYDLTAKNPNNGGSADHKDPKDLLFEIENVNYEIDKYFHDLKSCYTQISVGKTSLGSQEELPQGWQFISLAEIIDLKYGAGLSERQRIKGDIPVYGSNGIIGNHNSSLVNFPTIVVGRKGSVGKVHLVREPCWIIDTAFYVYFKNNYIFIDYLYLYLSILEGLLVFPKGVKPGINKNEYLSNKIPLPFVNNHPDLEKQREIVGHLEDVQSKIKQLSHFYELQQMKYTALSKSILNKAFRGQF